ncbi:hypothetical protein A2U01_0070578, partial [Trifolium medium]|nr:hypothetical protein [Trifolium medium]
VRGISVPGDLAVQVIRIRTVESKGLSLTTVLRTIEDLIALQTKGLGGVKLGRSRLASNVGKKGIMPMNVESKALPATTVRNRVILLEITKLQGPNRQQLQHK